MIYSSNEISSHPIQNYPTYKKPSGGIGKSMKKCVQYYHCYRSYFNFYCTCRQEGITCMILCNQQDSEASAYICAFYGRMPNRDQNATAMPRLRSSTVFWWAHETAGSVTGTLRRKKTERCHGLDLPLGCLDIYRMWLEMVQVSNCVLSAGCQSGDLCKCLHHGDWVLCLLEVGDMLWL